MKKYYVVETEFNEKESIEVNTLREAKKELKKCLSYYKDNMSDGIPPYKLMIVKYTDTGTELYREVI